MTEEPSEEPPDPVPGLQLEAIEFSDDDVPGTKELGDLHERAGRATLAADPDRLARAVDRSSLVVTARLEDGTLVGVARALSDDATVVHVEDVVVDPEHRRIGIGSVLVGRILTHYADLGRRASLVPHGDEEAAAFARAVGFGPSADQDAVVADP